jgi:threonine/homoserine/homoserine lactone efflux protein
LIGKTGSVGAVVIVIVAEGNEEGRFVGVAVVVGVGVFVGRAVAEAVGLSDGCTPSVTVVRG